MRAVVQKQSQKREAAQASAPRSGVANSTRDAGAGVRARGEAPEVVREVLGSEGKQLDESARLFMESRFGEDFSRVRVHTDAKAAESARALGALAYASGERIVFAEGRYRPASPDGRRLLAHELAHTLQRPSDGRVRRKIDFTQPSTPALSDPIPLVLGRRTILGETRPTVNGSVPGRGEKADYQTAVFNAIQPQDFTFSGKEGARTCKVEPSKFNVQISAAVGAITAPRNKQWAGAYEVANMKGAPQACKDRELGAVRVEMKGKPDSETLFNKVQTHEGEHVTDLKNLTASELKPYNNLLLGLTGAGKDEKECVNNLFGKVGTGKDGKDTKAVVSFVDKWQAAVNVYDKPAGTHHSKFGTTPDRGCAKLRIEEL